MAATRQDFILDEDGDFPLQDTYLNGVIQDTPYGDSDGQHILDIILYYPGYIKQAPLVGFGVKRYINSETSLNSIEKNLNIQLENDGYYSKNGFVEPTGKDSYEINSDLIFRK